MKRALRCMSHLLNQKWITEHQWPYYTNTHARHSKEIFSSDCSDWSNRYGCSMSSIIDFLNWNFPFNARPLNQLQNHWNIFLNTEPKLELISEQKVCPSVNCDTTHLQCVLSTVWDSRYSIDDNENRHDGSFSRVCENLMVKFAFSTVI